MKFFSDKKGAIDSDMLSWWLIGLAVLALVIGGYFVLKGKTEGNLDFIKNLFRFGSGIWFGI
ncbi:hypothetical protein K9L16_00450 [Candidatus Pacearchaeota archaeon]|nr:hypothetical protein [Candidatus Pacearchaeota archaeon]